MYYDDRKKLNIGRKLTPQLRMLPDFLVIGAQKSGTTSLFMDLVRHPCIEESFMKEVHYFDWAENYKKGLGWYRSHFPLKIKKYFTKILRGTPFVTGEASPDYLFYPHVSKRVAQLLPDVKIIVILRNPVDRAYSHYQHEFRGDTESLSFEEAVRIGDQELETEIQKMYRDENYCSLSFQCHTYLSRGIYWKQLQNWFHFFPREQFLILCSQAYFDEPAQEYQKITRFLGLPDFSLNKFKKSHQGNYKDSLSMEMRGTLNAFYKKHNEKLYECLGASYVW